MVFFKRRKPKLIDLIPQGFVDIHSHILPGLDDGAKNTYESLQLINGMKKLGFVELIATPHIMPGVWDNNNEKIEESYNRLINFIEEDEPKISYSSEYLIESSFLDKIQTQDLLCLRENYVLVELSYFQPPLNLYEILFELQLKGYIPVLAHPERYQYYYSDFSSYTKLKSAGCLFQLNLMSVVGHYGKAATVCAEKLLGADLIDFVGSDIHHKGHLEVFKKRTLLKNDTDLNNAIERNTIFNI